MARASIGIDAPVSRVWNALVNPDMIRQYLFGTEVVADWREGGDITWRGEWQGKRYVDKGVILRLEPGRVLRFTHYSPLSGLPDEPASYHTVTFELSEQEGQTLVSLTQDRNGSEEERAHSEQNWKSVLAALKQVVERSHSGP